MEKTGNVIQPEHIQAMDNFIANTVNNFGKQEQNEMVNHLTKALLRSRMAEIDYRDRENTETRESIDHLLKAQGESYNLVRQESNG